MEWAENGENFCWQYHPEDINSVSWPVVVLKPVTDGRSVVSVVSVRLLLFIICSQWELGTNFLVVLFIMTCVILFGGQQIYITFDAISGQFCYCSERICMVSSVIVQKEFAGYPWSPVKAAHFDNFDGMGITKQKILNIDEESEVSKLRRAEDSIDNDETIGITGTALHHYTTLTRIGIANQNF
ncbi:hypothetical protein HAX54_051678 [Datura stramonium]|uniref:Uncharacterized protein n=1 Tax=Datura stramonium TaxID=4076 RepID=A0ABS8SXX4_DATST|nr:hypothetical protein [Datura stramonium]